MDQRFLDSQKHRDVLPAFWPRKLSPYITALFVKTPITANQTTILWGIISAANSYVIYRVLTGDYLLLPVIPLVQRGDTVVMTDTWDEARRLAGLLNWCHAPALLAPARRPSLVGMAVSS